MKQETNRNIEAVLFDMDGLLLDTENVNYACWHKALLEQGIDYPIEEYKKLIGMRDEDAKVKLKPFLKGLSYEKTEQRVHDIFWQGVNEKGIPVKAGVYELLTYLAQENIKMAVVTSTTALPAKAMLEKTELLQYFSTVVTGDMVQNGKPAPEGYLLAVKRLNVDIEKSIGFEDSIQGLTALHNAKIRAVMVPDMIMPTAKTDSITMKTISTLNEAIDLIKTLQKH